jgi:site-specific recombinase XerD
MGAFREAMHRDLQIRGYSPKTIDLYLWAMRGLVRYHMRAPDQLSPIDINRYQQYMIEERRVSYSTFNVAVSAFRFFYTHTVPVPWKVTRLPYRKSPRTLPEILSREEIVRLFEAARTPRYRALFMTIYAAGLRVGEARRLRVGDFDAERMSVRIQRGKGGKDRYVPLATTLLDALAPYRTDRDPGELLFPGNQPTEPLDATTIQRTLRRAARDADIRKKVTPHSLRHAFATHLLEDGGHVRAVQAILGHRSLSTTTIYLHCTQSYIKTLHNPLDKLPLDRLPPATGGG